MQNQKDSNHKKVIKAGLNCNASLPINDCQL